MENVRLLKVQGYYNEDFSFDFTEEKSWSGHVILREDLTFEGIVNDYTSKDNDRLISGTLVEYHGASLMKFTNGGFCPFSFFGMSTGKEVLGSFAVHNYFTVSDLGRCKLIFTEVPMAEDVRSNIESRIISFKKEMDDFSKQLYESLIDDMSLTVSDFIENMKIEKEAIEAEIGAPLVPLELK